MQTQINIPGFTGTHSIKLTDIPGYEGLYAITPNGQVYSHPKEWTTANGGQQSHKGKWCALTPDKDGYLTVGLTRDKKNKMCKVHRLVALTFIPNPNSLPQINHKSGIKTDNRIKNLEWSTPRDNALHRFSTLGHIGLRGDLNPRSVLTSERVVKLRAMASTGNYLQKELALIFGISTTTVSAIINRIIWKHI